MHADGVCLGRPERPLNPEDSPLARFAFDLRELRRAADGISYRELAKRAHFSRTALSQAASGGELPTLPVTLAYVRACGGDTAAWEARWRALAESGSARSAAAVAQLAAARAVPSWRRRLVWLVVPTVLGVGLVGARQMTNGHRHPIGPARLQAAQTARSADLPLVPGDDDRFVADVTIPDGTTVRVNQRFRKVWEVQNTGSVAWRGRYLQRQGLATGRGLCTSPDRVRVPDTPPGARLRIAVPFVAPQAPGSCQVSFTFTDAAGREFFPGKGGLFVTVNVVT
jgi:hypothetical protein